VLARFVVFLSLYFERGHFDRHTAVVASEGNRRIDLAFAVVHRFAGILNLSRLAFAEFNRADRARFNRRIQFVFVVFTAHNGNLGAIAFAQFDTRNEFAFLAIFVLIGNLAAFLQRPFLAFATAAAFARRVGVDRTGAVQIGAVDSERDFLKFAGFGRLGAGAGRRLTGAAAAGTAGLARARVGGLGGLG